jgi:hypothetical protein
MEICLNDVAVVVIRFHVIPARCALILPQKDTGKIRRV